MKSTKIPLNLLLSCLFVMELENKRTHFQIESVHGKTRVNKWTKTIKKNHGRNKYIVDKLTIDVRAGK